MNSKKGFTLIELMVVILILGILASVAVPIFQGKVEEATRYSVVINYLESNYCVKVEYYPGKEEIFLIKEEDGSRKLVKLSGKYFLELETMLKKGDESMGTWTFELVVTDPPGAPDSLVWHGTRSQKQKEI